jgi:hypothetical protein
MKRFLLSLFLVIALASPGWAATWYVRPVGAEYGAEDGTTYATAFDGFADITWGVGGIVAGDTLYVCGTFAEQLTVGASGSAGLPITIRGDYPGDPGDITGSDARDYCIYASAKNYITIQNLTIHDAVTNGMHIEATSDHIIIQDCTAYDNGWAGISFASDGGADTNCYAYRNTCYGNLAYGGITGTINTSGEISGNIIYSNGDDNWADHGIYISGNNKNLVVKQNLSYSNAAAGIKVGSSSTGITIVYNITYSNGRAGIYCDAGSSGTDIYNHTDYSSNYGLYLQADGGNCTIDNVKNCILSTSDTSGMILNENVTNAVITSFTNNDVYGAGTSNYDIGTGTINGSGNDPTGSNGNISSDPLFTNAAGEDFRLRAGSPCIDTAADVSLTQDYAGNQITDTPDIGAYEYMGWKRIEIMGSGFWNGVGIIYR